MTAFGRTRECPGGEIIPARTLLGLNDLKNPEWVMALLIKDQSYKQKKVGFKIMPRPSVLLLIKL
jgi:hypothetical protein